MTPPQVPTMRVVVGAEEAPTVVLCGDFDQYVVARLRVCIAQALGAATTLLIVDTADVSFFDSACIGVLVYAHKQLAERGGRLVVANPSPPVKRMLEVTGLAPMLFMEPGTFPSDPERQLP